MDRRRAPIWRAERNPIAGWIVTDGNGNNYEDRGSTLAFVNEERAQGFAAGLNSHAAYIAGLRRAAGICEQKSVTAHTSTGAARAGACELAILAEADALEKGR